VDERAVTRDTALAINAHVVVLKSRSEFAEYRDVIEKAKKIAGVVSAEPFTISEMTATSAAARGPVDLTLKGVEPSGPTPAAITPMVKHGTFTLVATAGAPPPIVIADGLAGALVVKPGDDITVTVKPTQPPEWGQTDTRPYVFRVAGVIHTGIEHYDRELGYVSRGVLQDIDGRGDTPVGVELRVTDYKQSAAIARQLAAALGDPYQVQDWRELNPSLAQ
jgi:lipoprotein-releasing system permease protein